jgi:hypothetical protein
MNALAGLSALAGALLLSLTREKKQICVFEGRESVLENEEFWAERGVKHVPGTFLGTAVDEQFGKQLCVPADLVRQMRDLFEPDSTDRDFIEKFLAGFYKSERNNLSIGDASQQYTPIVKMRDIQGDDRLWAGVPFGKRI